MTPPSEHGFVAGLEALAFGVLVFVLGTLLLLDGWAVIDARFATNAAAREAVRAVVEAPADAALSGAELYAIGLDAARQAVRAHGYDDVRLTISPGSGTLSHGRCARVRIEASVDLRPTILPGIGLPTSRTVASEHEEVGDPFRSGPAVRDGLDRREGNACGF